MWRKWKQARLRRLAARHRKALHYRYIELSEMEPDLFPPGEASEMGAHVWRKDVPGCRGSTTYGGTKQDFDNMCNCSCGDLTAWMALASPPTRAG